MFIAGLPEMAAHPANIAQAPQPNVTAVDEQAVTVMTSLCSLLLPGTVHLICRVSFRRRRYPLATYADVSSSIGRMLRHWVSARVDVALS